MSATDYFLRIDGIEGESQDPILKDTIDIDSWSWGETNNGSHGRGGGGGAGKVSMQDFHFVAQTNKATPELMIACATGKHIPEAKLVCRKSGGKQEEYLSIILKGLLVSSFQTGGSEGDPVPSDVFTLSFSMILFDYQTQNEKGGLDSHIQTGWDVEMNCKL